MVSRRPQRVASTVQRSLAALLLQEPEFARAAVVAVELNADLGTAKVYIDNAAPLIKQLNVAAPRLRTRLAASLMLRNTPRLKFIPCGPSSQGA